MPVSYIVITDSARARILRFDHEDGQIESVEDLVHPDARKRERELDSDKAGRHPSSVSGGRHGVNRENKRHLEERRHFAGQLADSLEYARSKGRFTDLILIANPRFLGELRDQLSDGCAELVSHTLSRNLVTAPVDEILEHLSLPAQSVRQIDASQ